MFPSSRSCLLALVSCASISQSFATYLSVKPIPSTSQLNEQPIDESTNPPTDESSSKALSDDITAAIVICTVIGLMLIAFAVYKLMERHAPILLAAVSPSHRESLGLSTNKPTTQPKQVVLTEFQMKAISQATSRKSSMSNDKDSHAVDIPELSINEQWTVRSEETDDQ